MKLKMISLFWLICLIAPAQAKHHNFTVSVYVRAYEVEKMKDTDWLESTWSIISEQLDVDKIYLETHRDLLIVDDATLEKAKKFFKKQGVEVAGGITYTINEANNFETFCYSNPEHRRIVQEIAEHTARHFDEFLLDDFFFTSCKSEVEIETKGDRSWTEYRLALMNEAGKELVVDPAHRINPNVKVIIKYPNWYDHFQGLGFNLQDGPQIFDGVWCGTETRDPAGAQHLQNYLSYNVMRYYENLSGGRNGGGWVDAGGITMSMDRYAEQLHLTAISKARDIMLFAYNQLLDVKLTPRFRAPWQDGSTSWNYDEMTAAFRSKTGNHDVTPTTMARIADVVLHQADKLVGKIGNPVGIPNYKPFHSSGEDFLQNYLGMIGLPMEMSSSYPTEDYKVVLLTAQAASDADIMNKVKQSLKNGGNVVITSGLLKAIPEKIAEICELRCDDLKALVNDFGRHGQSERDILIPQVRYYTNDSWEVVSAGRPLRGGVSGFPILHKALYGGGYLYVLTIPDDFGQIYDYPAPALDAIRKVVCQDLDFSLEAPSKVSLFLYDNHTLIVENFNDWPVEVSLVCNIPFEILTNLENASAEPIHAQTGKVFSGWKATDVNRFTLTIPAHSYQAYEYE